MDAEVPMAFHMGLMELLLPQPASTPRGLKLRSDGNQPLQHHYSCEDVLFISLDRSLQMENLRCAYGGEHRLYEIMPNS